MKTKDATIILKKLGWANKKDEVGDSVAYLNLQDLVIQIIYRIRSYGEEKELLMMVSASNRNFIDFNSIIYNQKNTYDHIVTATDSKQNIKIIKNEVFEDDIQKASAQAIEWAKQQDLNAALQEYRLKKPVDCWGTLPVKHLAALAILGDIDKLKFYQTSFAAGDRLGFVPYITKDFIDRAVALAEQRLNGK